MYEKSNETHLCLFKQNYLKIITGDDDDYNFDEFLFWKHYYLNAILFLCIRGVLEFVFVL